MVYCNCANVHTPDCPNNKPGGMPSLKIEDNNHKSDKSSK